MRRTPAIGFGSGLSCLISVELVMALRGYRFDRIRGWSSWSLLWTSLGKVPGRPDGLLGAGRRLSKGIPVGVWFIRKSSANRESITFTTVSYGMGVLVV